MNAHGGLVAWCVGKRALANVHLSSSPDRLSPSSADLSLQVSSLPFPSFLLSRYGHVGSLLDLITQDPWRGNTYLLTTHIFSAKSRSRARVGQAALIVLVSLRNYAEKTGWLLSRYLFVYPRDLYNAATSRTLINPAIIYIL